MKICDVIVQHFDSIENNIHDIPASLVFLNVGFDKAKETLKIISPRFQDLHSCLWSRRQNEIISLISPNDLTVKEKYDSLIEEYKKHDKILNDIYEWKTDAMKIVFDNAESISTPLKYMLDSMDFLDFDIEEFYNCRNLVSEMRDRLVLDNLERSLYDPNFRMNYCKSKEELEYEKAYNYMHERILCRSAFLYNLVEPKDDPYDLYRLFKSFSWFILFANLEISDWQELCSDKLILYQAIVKVYSCKDNEAELL